MVINYVHLLPCRYYRPSDRGATGARQLTGWFRVAADTLESGCLPTGCRLRGRAISYSGCVIVFRMPGSLRFAARTSAPTNFFSAGPPFRPSYAP